MEQSLKCKCTCPGGLCNGEFSLYEVSETAYSRTYEYKCRRCGYTVGEIQYVNIEFLDGELAGVTIRAELPEFKTVED